MFYELIYTRCKNGIDLLRNGSPMTNEGYKIYSCSPEIYRDKNMTDLDLLVNAAQASQSYKDSQVNNFMDDAYLYYVPDYGEKFLINFHPVPFDPTRQGNYTKKPGNFLNQILIGDFSSFYIWQFFNDSSAWNAKQLDEPYYYANDPLPLKPRNIKPSGKYNYDAIRKFIHSGRRELLQKAIAFLISQYALDPAERKYLIIRDSCTENIELWIAAVECAFSPKISAGISFATRLDKYSNVNAYTVKNGKFQTMINYQDPEQSLRYRAMIVGVNVNDQDNNDNIRVFAASQFGLLDGIEMKTSFEPDIDIHSKYFDLITKFDGEHRAFCIDFLQIMSIDAPVADLPEIYNAFTAFNNIPELSIEEIIRHIKIISKYKFIDIKPIREVYSNVKNNIDSILSKNFAASLDIIKWLKGTAEKTGDNTINEFLISHVRNFADSSAKKFLNPENALNFYELYLKALNLLEKKISRDDILPVMSGCVNTFAKYKDIDGMERLFNISDNINLLLDAGKDNVKFTVESIIKIEPEIISSFSKTIDFCNTLNDKGMNESAANIISQSIRSIEDLDEAAKFPQWISETDYVGQDDKIHLFVSLDNRVKYGSGMKLPVAINKYRPEGAKCSRTANVLGLYIMKKAVNEKQEDFAKYIRKFESRGFPCMSDNQNFVDDFSSYFVEIKYSKEDSETRKYMFDLLFSEKTPREFLAGVVHELIANVEDYKTKWNFLLAYSAKNEKAKNLAFDAITDDILSSRGIKKLLKKLSEATSRKDPGASLFFAEIEEYVESNIKPGIFEKVLGVFRRKKSENEDNEDFE